MLSLEAFKRQSNILNSLRIPATVLVIWSHCVVVTEQEFISFDLTISNIFSFWEALFRSFGPIAVSMFALISGYYFFYKYERFGAKDYVLEVKKRITSLYLPFILWNAITWLALFAKNKIALAIDFPLGFNAVEDYIVRHTHISDVFYSSIDYPLWYVKSILLLCLATPLIYLAIRYAKYLVLPILVLFSMGCLGLDTGLHQNTITYFCLGAFLGYYKSDMIALAQRFRWLSYITGWLYCYARTFGAGTEWMTTLMPLFLFCSVFALLNLATDIYKVRPAISAWFSSFNSAAFFMYAAHTIIFINLIRGSLYALIPWDNDWERLLALMLTSLSVPVCTYYSYKLLSAMIPKISQILSGGRG